MEPKAASRSRAPLAVAGDRPLIGAREERREDLRIRLRGGLDGPARFGQNGKRRRSTPGRFDRMEPSVTSHRKDRRWALAAAALGVATALVYAQVVGHEFLSYDDDDYVTANAHVRRGLTWDGVAWAFASTEAANWHPVTWLSHMLDVELFGVSAGAHHAVSAALHALAAALLALVWARMTGAPGRSLAMAALFALHPLRVESVAWIAERKDVLGALLWIATLGAYAEYVRRPGRGRYLLVVAAYALGLMAKPSLVTLPFALLLLDAWPLGRLPPGPDRRRAAVALVR